MNTGSKVYDVSFNPQDGELYYMVDGKKKRVCLALEGFCRYLKNNTATNTNGKDGKDGKDAIVRFVELRAIIPDGGLLPVPIQPYIFQFNNPDSLIISDSATVWTTSLNERVVVPATGKYRIDFAIQLGNTPQIIIPNPIQVGAYINVNDVNIVETYTTITVGLGELVRMSSWDIISLVSGDLVSISVSASADGVSVMSPILDVIGGDASDYGVKIILQQLE